MNISQNLLDGNLFIKLQQAADFESAGKKLHALQIYLKLFLQFPHQSNLAIRIASLYNTLNNTNASLKFLEEFIENNPTHYEVQIYYSETLIENSEFEKAISVLSKVGGSFSPIAKYFTGVAYFYLQEYEIAKINFETVIRNQKDDDFLFSDALLFLAKANIKMGLFDNALENIKQLENTPENDTELKLVLAQIYYEKSMFFHAYDVIKDEPDIISDSEINYWKGKILYRMGEFKKAKNYLTRALQFGKAELEIFSMLGNCCLNLNLLPEAKTYFNLALKINPEEKTAQDGLLKCE